MKVFSFLIILYLFSVSSVYAEQKFNDEQNLDQTVIQLETEVAVLKKNLKELKEKYDELLLLYAFCQNDNSLVKQDDFSKIIESFSKDSLHYF